MRRLPLCFIALIFVALLAVSPCLDAPTTAQAQTASRKLTILHTNALFAHIQEFRPRGQALQGGVSRLLTKVRELRAANPANLLLSSGDDVMGTSVFVEYGGVPMGEIMSRIAYDAALASPFDIMAGGSVDGFAGFRSVASFRLVNANIILNNLPDAQVAPQALLTRGGVRVGVFGLVHEQATLLAPFGEAATMRDTDEVIRENLDRFAAAKVDIVVLLSSLGMARDKEVAEKYGGPQGIDVIVGNAGDALLGDRQDLPAWEIEPAGPYPLVYGDKATPVAVVYAHEHGSYLGQLDLTFDSAGILTGWGGKLHFLGENIPRDPPMQLMVEKLAATLSVNRIDLGDAAEDLPGAYRDYPWQEIPLADIYADIFLEYARLYGARLALVNSGMIWGGFPRGVITEADLYRVQPFSDWLIIMDITGAQLMEALENSVSTYGGEVALSGRFLHVAGMSYAFDPTRPVGSRIVEARVDGQLVKPEDVFSIATNNFLASGGDGYTSLHAGTNLLNTGIAVRDIAREHIIAYSPLVRPTMNRITNRATKK